MFCKMCVLKNFVKFTGKKLCQSPFFNKVAGLRPVTLLKKRLWQMFSCEFREIFRNTFFTEHLRWLLLNKTYKKMSVWSPWNYFFSSSFDFFIYISDSLYTVSIQGLNFIHPRLVFTLLKFYLVFSVFGTW